MRLFPLLILLVACDSTAAPMAELPALQEGHKEAIFAGGCFWCMEKPFDKVEGVLSTTSGYTGGDNNNPTYEQVSMHRTTHLEALRVTYDPAKVSYEQLLTVYWHNVDPTQGDGQFCDRGDQYRSALFPQTPEEKAAAEKGKALVAEQLGKPVVTAIRDASTFWPAEEYHQDYYLKNPDHYLRYRTGCGRDRRLAELWGDTAGH